MQCGELSPTYTQGGNFNYAHEALVQAMQMLEPLSALQMRMALLIVL